MYRAVPLLVILLAGCASWRREPALLEFPQPPHVEFFLCRIPKEHISMVCLSQDDASALVKWMDKLDAFEAARQRLLRD